MSLSLQTVFAAFANLAALQMLHEKPVNKGKSQIFRVGTRISTFSSKEGNIYSDNKF
jgi:hypothetical protein